MIVNGSVRAQGLLVQILADPGEPLVAEDSGFNGIQHVCEANGVTFELMRVGGEGVRIADWSACLYLTPERRLEVLKWARRRFRYQVRQIEPLKSPDQNGRIVYFGTFSKPMFLEIRVGYVVFPASLREPFAKA